MNRRKSMNRRKFLVGGGVGLAAGTIAAPALAQTMPKLNWRMTASWPKSLETIYGGAEYFAKRIGEMTDGNFQIRTFAAGDPGVLRRRDRAGAAGARRGAEWYR